MTTLIVMLFSCAYDPVASSCARSHTTIVMVPHRVGKITTVHPQPMTVCDERVYTCTREPGLDPTTCRARYPEPE